MKKLFKKIALVLALVASVSMLNLIPASALTPVDNTVEIPVKYTDVIGSTTGTAVEQSAAGHFVDGETGSHSYYYKFTLDTPCLVSISTYANVLKYNFHGDALYYIGTDVQYGYNFLSAWAQGETKICEGALEAGTYYIRQDIVKSNTAGPVENPIVSVAVTAQTLPRTGNMLGSTKENAIPVANDVTSKGILTANSDGSSLASNCIGRQFFKVEVNSPTTLTYTAAFSRHTSLSMQFDKRVAVIDKNGAELEKKDVYGTEGSISSTVKLPAKGTYYITVTSDKFMAIDLTAVWEEVVVVPSIKLTVKKIKKNAKKVTGTSVAGASIKVKAGAKTYKGKANASGKFTIKTKKIKKGTKVKVTASMTGYKTKSKTIKVK